MLHPYPDSSPLSLHNLPLNNMNNRHVENTLVKNKNFPIIMAKKNKKTLIDSSRNSAISSVLLDSKHLANENFPEVIISPLRINLLTNNNNILKEENQPSTNSNKCLNICLLSLKVFLTKASPLRYNRSNAKTHTPTFILSKLSSWVCAFDSYKNVSLMQIYK